jgi:carbonic anhydrase
MKPLYSLTALFLFLILSAIPASSPAKEVPGVTPADALMRLKTGNAAYVLGKARHPDQAAVRRKETAENGQKPFASILACSDSRVPPEILFDQGVGGIFVVRVAGNVAGTDEIGSLEYGTEHLGTPLLVVMGHTKCGAVTAAVKGGQAEGSIPALLEKIAPAIAEARKSATAEEELVPKAIKENVWKAIETVFTQSKIVRERVEKGELRVVGAIYDIASGEVKWLGPHPKQKELMESAASQAEEKNLSVGKVGVAK